jgi:hypothetical protein
VHGGTACLRPTRVRREPSRGVYDRATVDAILRRGLGQSAGPPKDNEEDYGWPIWAGVIPLSLTAGEPEPDPALEGDFEPPVWSPTVRVRGLPGQNGK